MLEKDATTMDRVGSRHFSALDWRKARVSCLWPYLLLFALLGTALSPQAQGDDASEEPPAPRNLELQTRDGVQLKAVYYEGAEGEATVPVIVIHDWQEKGSDYEPLAEYLQEQWVCRHYSRP